MRRGEIGECILIGKVTENVRAVMEKPRVSVFTENERRNAEEYIYKEREIERQ